MTSIETPDRKKSEINKPWKKWLYAFLISASFHQNILLAMELEEIDQNLPSQLIGLPVELWKNDIFPHMSAKDIRHLSSTCRQFYQGILGEEYQAVQDFRGKASIIPKEHFSCFLERTLEVLKFFDQYSPLLFLRIPGENLRQRNQEFWKHFPEQNLGRSFYALGILYQEYSHRWNCPSLAPRCFLLSLRHGYEDAFEKLEALLPHSLGEDNPLPQEEPLICVENYKGENTTIPARLNTEFTEYTSPAASAYQNLTSGFLSDEFDTQSTRRALNNLADLYLDELKNPKEAFRCLLLSVRLLGSHELAYSKLMIFLTTNSWDPPSLHKEGSLISDSHQDIDFEVLTNRIRLCYEKGDDIAKNKEKAFLWLKNDAQYGSPHAQYELGSRYFLGRGTQQNYKEAVKWYQRAADQGHTEAQFLLAKRYRDGLGIPQDHKKAVEWLKKIANQGYTKAQSLLAKCYKEGTGVPEDPQKAMAWARKAADQGDTEAQFLLAHCYMEGISDCQQSAGAIKKEKAIKLLGEAAKKGHKEAIRELENLSINGDSEAQAQYGRYFADRRNLINAGEWYYKAAKQGHREAFLDLEDLLSSKNVSLKHKEGQAWYRVGEIYELYKEWQSGPLKNPIFCYNEAAKRGHNKAFQKLIALGEKGNQDACRYLMELYHYKYQDKGQLAYWCQKKAESGDHKAQFSLAKLYKTGEGVEKNPQKALEWLEKASDGGNQNASYSLAEYYTKEEKDSSKAFKFWKRAAQCGDEEASYHVASYYLTLPNYPPIIPLCYLKIAIKKPHKEQKEAQYQLGEMLADGLGTEQEKKDAVSWYNMAAKQGHEKAREKLIKLGSLLMKGQDKLSDTEKIHSLYACWFLGKMYKKGNGVLKDKNQAAIWFYKLIKHKELSKKIPFLKHNLYYMGGKKLRETFYSFEKQKNRSEILYRYAELQYKEQGHVYECDLTNYKKSAKQGHKKGLLRWLQRATENGFLSMLKGFRRIAEKITDKNPNDPKTWRDLPYQIAEIYENDPGNFEEANFWYMKAAKRGKKEAAWVLSPLHQNFRNEGCSFAFCEKYASPFY